MAAPACLSVLLLLAFVTGVAAQCFSVRFVCGTSKQRLKFCSGQSVAEFRRQGAARLGVAPERFQALGDSIPRSATYTCSSPQSAESNLQWRRHYDLANDLLFKQGRFSEAEREYRAALALNPVYVKAYTNLGELLNRKGQLRESLALFQIAADLQPASPITRTNLASLMQRVKPGDLAADEHLRAAINMLPPQHPGAARIWWNLVLSYQERVDLVGGAVVSGQALSRYPEDQRLRTSFTYHMIELCYWNQIRVVRRLFEEQLQRPPVDRGHATGTAVSIAQLLRLKPSSLLEFATRMSLEVRKSIEHLNAVVRSPARVLHSEVLNVGYVTSDLQDHPVGRCVEAMMLHQMTRFNPVVFSLASHTNSLVNSLNQTTAIYELENMPATDAAEIILGRDIHILIDLNGYTKYHRSDIFALSPGVVQLSAIGFELSLASASMTYILADRTTLAPQMSSQYWEKPVFMPFSYLPTRLTFDRDSPPDHSNIKPAMSLFLASLNHNGKLDRHTFVVWMQTLRRAEHPRLGIKGALDSPTLRNLLHEASAAGIPQTRLVPQPHMGSRSTYLDWIGQTVDLALDPIAYGGQTTSADALSRAVPIVSLTGGSIVSRYSDSGMRLLLGIDAPSLTTSKGYEDACVELAG